MTKNRRSFLLDLTMGVAGAAVTVLGASLLGTVGCSSSTSVYGGPARPVPKDGGQEDADGGPDSSASDADTADRYETQ